VTAVARVTRTRWRPAGLAWALWALAMLGLAVAARLDQLLREAGRPELLALTPKVIPPVLGAVSVATVGAVLASRRPRHPVGWLLLAFGLSLSAAGSALAYTNYGVAHADAPAAALVPCTCPPPSSRRSPATASSCCSPRPGRCRRPAGAGGRGSPRPRRSPWCWS
jgi:hypothetical protein